MAAHFQYISYDCKRDTPRYYDSAAVTCQRHECTRHWHVRVHSARGNRVVTGFLTEMKQKPWRREFIEDSLQEYEAFFIDDYSGL